MNSRSSRWWRTVFVLLVIYALAGFFALPFFVKQQVERKLGAALERRVTVGRVRTNPFALSVTLERLDVATADAMGTLFGWDELYINFDALGSLGGDWVCSAVALRGFHATVEVDPDGSSNFSYLIEKFSKGVPDETAKKMRAWRFGRIDLAAGRLEMVDHSRAENFTTTVGPIDCTLLDFSTAGDRGAPYQFTARTEAGEKIDWSGSLRAAPLASIGEWRIENLLLPKYAPYFQDRLSVLLTSGKLTADGKYEFDLAPGHRRLALTGGRLQLEKVQLVDRAAGQPVLDLAEFEASGIAADGLAGSWVVDAIRLSGGRASIKRASDGSLNLLGARPAPKPAPPSPAAIPGASGPAGASAGATPAAPKPPQVAVKEISLRDFEVKWNDAAARRPVDLELTRVTASLKNFSLERGATMPLTLTFACKPQGTVNVVAQVAIQPWVGEADLEIAWLPLAPISPYLESFWNGRVQRGSVSLKGHASFSRLEGESPEGTFAGDCRIEDCAVTDTAHGDELIGCADFAVNELQFASAPRLSIRASEVKLGAPFVHLTMAADKTIDLAELWREGNAAKASPATVRFEAEKNKAQAEGPSADLAVQRFTIDGGEFRFTDRSITPAAVVTLKEISGMMRDLSSNEPERGEVELHAMAGGAAPIAIRGRVNPLAPNPFAELKATAEAVDLAPAAPYVGKFAGFELEHGTLTLDTDARVRDQKLDLYSEVTLDQFRLGRATGSPEAVKLPVRLGIALLKDAQGKIVLQLPVQGWLDDPQFSIGPIVGQVLTKLLAKAATSPFALLGSMFGGGGEELAEQDFAPGEASPTEESERRLTTLARALANRPALRLELEGGYDSAADRPGVVQVKLDGLIRARVAEERKARGGDGVAPDEMLISNLERAAAVEKLFEEKFPAPGAPPAVVATPPPAVETHVEPAAAPSRPGFLRRAVNIVTLKGLRERRSERSERAREEEEAAAAAEAAKRAAPKPETPARALPSIEEMTDRLVETMTVGREDFEALAAARAQRVKDRLVGEGKIASERIAIKQTNTATAEQLGLRVKLQLR